MAIRYSGGLPFIDGDRDRARGRAWLYGTPVGYRLLIGKAHGSCQPVLQPRTAIDTPKPTSGRPQLAPQGIGIHAQK